MKLNKILISFNDWLWYKVLGGSRVRQEYKKRCDAIISTFINILGQDECYVIDGKWSWYQEPKSGIHPPITILFYEKPLCVMVFGPEVGQWNSCKLYCRNKKSWELANSLAAYFESLVKKVKMPTLTFYWNDPIDISSIYLKLGAGELNDGNVQ